jgi:protein-disulfide isomerase
MAALGTMALRGLATAALAAVVLSVAACGGTGPSLPAVATGGAGTPDRIEGNPFQDTSVQALAGRTVIANPSIADIMQPASGLAEMSLGRADAPVTFIKYASMTCPYCRQFQIEVFPELKRQYIDTGKMRFIVREFPIGFQSGAATIALRCVPPSKYFQLYDRLMRQQAIWVSQEVRIDPIVKVAAEVGLTREQFDACRQNQGMVQSLAAIKERGRTLGVIGTPNFFVNGKLIKTVLTLKDVKALVDPLIAGDAPLAQRS